MKIINKSKHPLPKYQTNGSAGMDLTANLEAPIHLNSLERRLIPTGIYVELAEGHEGQIRPRSGLALKQGITVLNAPGTIDSDYRGEIGVILINLSKTMVKINDGDRIAQMVIARYKQLDLLRIANLTDTIRGEGGFGSTGKD